jgi:hypothetical protein
MAAAKAREIADDAAAERDHNIVALDARIEQPVADVFQHLPAFRLLAGGHNDRRGANARRGQRVLRSFEVPPPRSRRSRSQRTRPA